MVPKIILSVGLPCLDDEHFIKGILNAHINYLETLENKLLSCKVLPDIYKRTEITLHFTPFYISNGNFYIGYSI